MTHPSPASLQVDVQLPTLSAPHGSNQTAGSDDAAFREKPADENGKGSDDYMLSTSSAGNASLRAGSAASKGLEGNRVNSGEPYASLPKVLRPRQGGSLEGVEIGTHRIPIARAPVHPLTYPHTLSTIRTSLCVLLRCYASSNFSQGSLDVTRSLHSICCAYA